jgi:hypothetical protein
MEPHRSYILLLVLVRAPSHSLVALGDHSSDTVVTQCPLTPFLTSCEPPQNEKKKKRRRKKKKDGDEHLGGGSGLATPGREKFTRGGGSHNEFFSQHNSVNRAGVIDVTLGEKQQYQSRRSLERNRSARFYHGKGNTEAG